MMTDLTLKKTFIDHGGNQVFDVYGEPITEPEHDQHLGTTRLAPDPRIEELKTENAVTFSGYERIVQNNDKRIKELEDKLNTNSQNFQIECQLEEIKLKDKRIKELTRQRENLFKANMLYQGRIKELEIRTGRLEWQLLNRVGIIKELEAENRLFKNKFAKDGKHIKELEAQNNSCNRLIDKQNATIKELQTELEYEKKYDIEKQRDIWAENCKKAWVERDSAWATIKELEADKEAEYTAFCESREELQARLERNRELHDAILALEGSEGMTDHKFAKWVLFALGEKE